MSLQGFSLYRRSYCLGACILLLLALSVSAESPESSTNCWQSWYLIENGKTSVCSDGYHTYKYPTARCYQPMTTKYKPVDKGFPFDTCFKFKPGPPDIHNQPKKVAIVAMGFTANSKNNGLDAWTADYTMYTCFASKSVSTRPACLGSREPTGS